MARVRARSSLVFTGRKSSSSWALVLAVLLSLSVGLLTLLTLSIFSLPVSQDSPELNPVTERRLGDTPVASRTREAEIDGSTQRGEPWTEVLSWEPRVFIYHNFLSRGECEYLIELAKPHVKKSQIINSTTGQSEDSSERTSSGMSLVRGHGKIIQAIEKRIADFTFIPIENGEDFHVLHYEVGQKYVPHYDYFADEFNIQKWGQRMATVLMYLSDVEEGGETIFPFAKVSGSSLRYYNELSECGRNGLAINPKMGDAVLFWSVRPDATFDPSSFHGGCPVIKGDKWLATLWIHLHEFKSMGESNKVNQAGG